MAATLELCQLEIQELSRRLERLELALSRNGQVSPAPPPRRHIPETVVMAPRAVFPALRFDQEQAEKSRPAEKVEARAALEDYPRVLDRIRMLWFYPECEQLLDKLIIDDRGNRSGFSRDIMDELLFLARLARAVKLSQGLSPKGAGPERHDVWEDLRLERHA
jgi:hypothetical protein